MARARSRPDTHRMTAMWGIIAVLLLIVWGLTIVDIVRRHLGTRRTAAWLLIVVLLPFLGTLLYLVLREPSPAEAEREAQIDDHLEHDAARPPLDRTRFGA
jgi:uncharacterized protein (DUF58 family)